MVLKYLLKPRAHLLAIFVISLAVLAYQVLLTRIFSVVLYYHYAFVGISLAMLGLTIGAIKVFLNEKRFSQENLDLEWAKAALGFAVTSILLVLVFLYLPALLPPALIWLVRFMPTLFVIPFTYSGICVTLILTKSPVAVSKLYAADLIGAALGCSGIVAGMFVLDPVSLILGLSLLTIVAAGAVLNPARIGALRIVKIFGLLCLIGFMAQAGLYLTGRNHLGVVWAKTLTEHGTLFERWNTYSRVRVFPFAASQQYPHGWGFGHPQTEPIPQLFLNIDADAGTVITHFDGDLKPLAFLGNDIVNVAYHVKPISDVAVIGVGGGRDLLSALYFHAHHATGIELNPANIEALTERFGDFAGHLERRPDVTLVNAEARSWLNQSSQKFDFIQVSLIDTWAATVAGGLTLSENKLYTDDAWRDFLDRLNPDGMLSVSRWFDPEVHQGEFYRLLSLAVSALEQEGVPPNEVRGHILAFNVKKIITVVIGKSVFSPEQLAHARRAAADEGFKIMIDPQTAWDPTSNTIASGMADQAFYDALPIDVTPTTDDRPYFFYIQRPRHFFATPDVGGITEQSALTNTAISVIVFLLLGTTFSMLVSIFLPLWVNAKSIPLRAASRHLGYFAGIGLGFMLIEVSQMQRLMIFLGHPVYGLTVVLLTLLLFGGIGSGLANIFRRNSPLIWSATLCVVLCSLGLATPVIVAHLRDQGIATRIAVSIALLAPAALCMGTMFPAGMGMSQAFPRIRPWFWAINGAASVFASVAGVVLSMQFGITLTYWAGVACYTFCFGLVAYGLKTERPE